jgi:hypothetical protein
MFLLIRAGDLSLTEATPVRVLHLISFLQPVCNAPAISLCDSLIDHQHFTVTSSECDAVHDALIEE